jgi:hypothetical protein
MWYIIRNLSVPYYVVHNSKFTLTMTIFSRSYLWTNILVNFNILGDSNSW